MTVSIRYPKGLWPQAGTDYSAVHWKMQVPRRSLVVIVDGRQLRPINVLSSWHGLRLDSDCLRKCHASAECPNRLPMKAQKVEMSLSSIRKGCHRGFFFLRGQKCFRGQSLPPRVVFTHERSEGCNWDPRGVNTAQGKDTLLSEETKKYSKEHVTSFHVEWMFYIHFSLYSFKTASKP